jgi:aspartate carbamoyltransferase
MTDLDIKSFLGGTLLAGAAGYAAYKLMNVTPPPLTFPLDHILSVDQQTPETLEQIFLLADKMRDIVASPLGKSDCLNGKVLANVFYEPSTRTSCSFQAAMLRLGGQVIPVNESSSSAKKGETLGDTVRCLECYCDVMVLRHPVKGSADEAAAVASIPILNAGDGVGEHPTQALLDIYTIRHELLAHNMKLDGKVVAMVGDLKNGRTVHSLSKLLARHFDVELHFVSPESLKMPAELVEECRKAGATVKEFTTLDESVAVCDVMYVTRVQKERFATAEEYDAVKDVYCITSKTMKPAKPTMVLLHPLPRVGEIKEEVDSDPRAAYFRQMKNGMYVRMALLALLLKAPV